MPWILENINIIIDSIIGLVVLGLFSFLSNKIIKPIYYYSATLIYFIIAVFLLFFKLYLSLIIVTFLFLVIIIVICLLFQNDIRRFQNKLHAKILVGAKSDEDASYDDLFESLERAVLQLSESQTGAIIVIERKANLDDYSQDSLTINCPVSAPILTTIFYNGTALHDGAVIIRGNTILRAHTFLPSSDKGLSGHYGARHRAAIGISEVTDAF
ncbi:MAG: diadenylate cyclase, partial [Bacillales bacterium]|nr:diadenylate cyclase [Bacillales bacterium]